MMHGHMTRDYVKQFPQDPPSPPPMRTDLRIVGAAGARHPLRPALSHKSPRVQFFAAISLGKHKGEEAAPGLINLLATGGSQDP